jgi:hypothetical protein
MRQRHFVPDWFREPARNVPNLRATKSDHLASRTPQYNRFAGKKGKAHQQQSRLRCRRSRGRVPSARFQKSPPNRRAFCWADGSSWGESEIGHQNWASNACSMRTPRASPFRPASRPVRLAPRQAASAARGSDPCHAALNRPTQNSDAEPRPRTLMPSREVLDRIDPCIVSCVLGRETRPPR